MSAPSSIAAIGIVAKNSVGYIDAVFKAYNDKKTFVSIKDGIDSNQIPGVNIETIVDPASETGWFFKKQDLFYFDDIAQISFTSGTEGNPKGILLSHRNLANVIERLNKAMELDDSVREYVGVPVLHSFGLARVRACASVGGASFIPENGFNPMEIAGMLETGQINAISAVPTLWRILLDNNEVIGTLGERVKWVEIGSQFMSGEEKKQLRAIFPNARIIQHYGLTEASRTTFLDVTNTDDPALSSVGAITDDIEVLVDRNGLINIKGEHVAKYYLGNGSIHPLINADGFLITSDLGEIKNGHLYYTGRADDIINCGGIKISPDVIERKLARTINISDGVAVARTQDPLRGDGILVVCEGPLKMPLKEIEDKTRSILKELGVTIGNSLRIIEISSIPRTKTGKVKRSLLSSSYGSQNDAPLQNQASSKNTIEQMTSEQKELTDIWCKVLSIDSVSIHSSFYDFGGDSLSSINLMLTMEQQGIDQNIIHDIVNGKTIAEVTGKQSKENNTTNNNSLIKQTSEAINAVRGIMVFLLVFIHWSPGVFERLSIDYVALTNPLFRFGTPGFAMIFGLSTGFYIFHQFKINPFKAKKNIKVAQIMLTVGIGLLATIKFLILYLNNQISEVHFITNIFYSALLYYLLAVSTIPVWYSILKRFENIEIATLLASGLMFVFGFLANWMLPTSEHLSGFWRLGGLMIEAKFNYFAMTGTVFLGLALGLYFKRVLDAGKRSPDLIGLGLCLIIFGLLISYQTDQIELWLTAPVVTIWMLITYFGVLMCLISLLMRYSHAEKKSSFVQFIFRILAIFGLLSLPMYIGHGIVIPLKDLLVILGLPYLIALSISMLLFFSLIGYAVTKLYNMYYVRKISAT